jgi:hypothetical protein
MRRPPGRHGNKLDWLSAVRGNGLTTTPTGHVPRPDGGGVAIYSIGGHMKNYTFGHLTLALLSGVLLMGIIMSLVPRQYHRFAPERQALVETPKFSVPTHASMNSRWSSERFYVFGRETWMLYDKETQTQYITDAKHSERCWTAVKL